MEFTGVKLASGAELAAPEEKTMAGWSSRAARGRVPPQPQRAWTGGVRDVCGRALPRPR
jgi:hypothetical protein